MWYENQIGKLDNITLNLDDTQLKKYKIVKLKILMEIISNQSDGCDACEMYKSTIERMIRTIDNGGSIKEYDHLMKLIKHHLIEDHDYVPALHQMLLIVLLAVSFVAVIGSFVFNDWLLVGILGAISGIIVGIFMNIKHLSSDFKM